MYKAFKIFDKVVKGLLAALIIAMTCVELAQIVFRFILRSPLAWSEESVRYMFIYATFLSIGIGIDRGAHANLDLFMRRFKGRAGMIYQTVLWVLAIVFFVILIANGIPLALANRTQLTPAMRMPFMYVILGVPIGSAIAIIYLIKNILVMWLGDPDKKAAEAAVQTEQNPAEGGEQA